MTRCKHQNTELRLRRYPGGGRAAVQQCVDCGHHVKAVALEKVPDPDDLPPYREPPTVVRQPVRGLFDEVAP